MHAHDVKETDTILITYSYVPRYTISKQHNDHKLLYGPSKFNGHFGTSVIPYL